MKKFPYILLIFLIVLSCSNNVPITTIVKNTSNNSVGNNLINQNLTGTVYFTNSFRTKTNVSDVAVKSRVSIIYTPDTPLKANSTLATGLTDETGNFDIKVFSDQPEENQVFILEAVKRVNIDAGNQVLSLRTFVRWKYGTGWESITGTKVIVDAKTTALAIMAESGEIPVTSTFNTISFSGNTPVFIDSLEVEQSRVLQVSNLVDSLLVQDKDPVASIKLVNNQYVPVVKISASDFLRNNSCVACDLSGINLSNIGLSGRDLSYSNLSGQDLSNKDLSGTILIGANLVGTKLPDDLSYIDFSKANLSGQNITDKNITGTIFVETNFTNALLSSESKPKDLTKARFTGANFTGASLVSGNFTKVYLFETKMNNTKIKNANFTTADLTGVDFSNVYNKDFTSVNFNSTNLKGSAFTSLDLANVNLSNAKLEGSDFSKSILKDRKLNSKLANCNFAEATIDGSGSESGKFSNIDFSSANFAKAKIKNVNFNNIDCRNCDFSEAEFNNVKFDNSNLESASFDKITIHIIDSTNFYDIDFNISNSDLKKSSFKDITSEAKGAINATDLSYADVTNSVITNFTFIASKADYTKFDNSSIFGFDNSRTIYFLELFKKHITNDTNVLFPVPSIYSNDYIDSSFYRNNAYLFDPSVLASKKYYKIIEKAKPLNTAPPYDEPFIVYTSESNSDYPISQNRADALLTKFDIAPETAIKNISFKNSSGIYISGYFVNSDFSNTSYGSGFYGYYKACKFDNTNIYGFGGVSINNTFDEATIVETTGSYFKDTSFSVSNIHSSFLVNSSINNNLSTESYNDFFIYNSNSGGLPCRKTFDFSGTTEAYGTFYLVQNIITDYRDLYYDWCSPNQYAPQ